jgi:GNAT superfamily N-acetyltransferase
VIKLQRLDDVQLFERQRRSLHAFYRMMVSASGGRFLETDRLTACVIPATPERSVCNGVVYDEAGSLVDELDGLTEGYDAAGIKAWTVWVPAGDRTAREALAERGHMLDAAPAAMAFELATFEREESAGAEIDSAGDPSDIGRINDIAYGYDGDFTRAIQDLAPEVAHPYLARIDGSAVASTVALDCEGDCCITLVATLPEARGRGLATELITRALNDARERGCATTSLQATQMGKPVYERLGYRDLGPYEMWERRRI